MDQSKNDIDVRIGAAWKAHYRGQDDIAIEQFRQLVAEAPDHIDANWGLGLSYRDAGRIEDATQVFHKVKDLVGAQLEEQSTERERFVMLSRMVDQQLAQINEFHGPSPEQTKAE